MSKFLSLSLAAVLTTAAALPAAAQPPAGSVGTPYADFGGTYNAAAPVLLRGTLSAVNRQNGGALLTVNADGRTWTVSSNSAGGEQLAQQIGQSIIIRGFNSVDGACCNANARDVTLTTGARIMTADGLMPSPSALAAGRAASGGPPASNPASSGAPAQGAVIQQSPLTNSVVREGQAR